MSKTEKSALSWDEAIALIQIHERARQGRLRFNLMKQIRQQKTAQGRGLHKSRPSMTPSSAAQLIQSHWRRFLATKRVHRMRRQEMIFLGMVPSFFTWELKKNYIINFNYKKN